METLKVQSQIRQNAEEISAYLTDMAKWEKNITKKDQAISSGSTSNVKALPVRLGSGTVKVIEKVPTVDKNVISKNNKGKEEGNHEVSVLDSNNSDGGLSRLTPASLATLTTCNVPAVVSSSNNTMKVPIARGIANTKDAELVERERGNMEYETGNFLAAVKSYTKCLGMKVSIVS